MFHFVTVAHPDEVKSKKQQETIRGHAIRHGLSRKKEVRVSRAQNFVSVDMASKKQNQAVKRKGGGIPKVPSAGNLDPFECLPGDAEPLRGLIKDQSIRMSSVSSACAPGAWQVYSKGLNNLLRDALANPSLFNTLSMVLTIADSERVSDVACLTHRGHLYCNLNQRMGDAALVPHVSTLTAMLLLIGFEFRIDGVDGRADDRIAMHVRALDETLKVRRHSNVAMQEAIRRALFWQDLYSCLFIGTPRLLSHRHYPEMHSRRDTERPFAYVVPAGFNSVLHMFPLELETVLEDLNALCLLVDRVENSNKAASNDGFQIDDGQAWIESRIVDLLSDSREAGQDAIYQACLFATFLCTYMLSIGIWQGCFIPEFCSSSVLGLVQVSKADARWAWARELQLWMLFASGALSTNRTTREQTAELIKAALADVPGGHVYSFEQLEGVLRTFVWCERSMEQKAALFWKEMQESWPSGSPTSAGKHKDFLACKTKE